MNIHIPKVGRMQIKANHCNWIIPIFLLRAIEVLNLNCPALRDERKKCIDALLSVLGKKTKDEWKEEINKWLESETYPSFIELRLQYMNKFIGL